jgi:hypothetical protein
VARRESDEGICSVYVFGVHGEILYLTADNRQGLATAFSTKPYQSYVMVRKALFMPRNEPQGSKPQFFCSVRDTQSELNSDLARFLSRKFSGVFTKAYVLLANTKEWAWDIVGGIPRCYGLDGPALQRPGGHEIFFSLHTSRPAFRLTQARVQWIPCLSLGVRRPGRGVEHPPPSSADTTHRWRFTFALLFVPPGGCYGETFTFLMPCSRIIQKLLVLQLV